LLNARELQIRFDARNEMPLCHLHSSQKMQTRKPAIVLFALLLLSMARAQTAHEHGPSTNDNEGSFTALMARAMERMHTDMNIVPSGDYDRDFAAMMIPHHQGAVDMAKVELQFGKNPILRRLAQGIIVEQLQEIEVMQRELQQLPMPPREP
jgi:uncharacterized protein (DUF305 family)